VAKLKELNPQFDAALAKHKIENDAVVELSFPSSEVTDISPVAALKQLRVFECNGRGQAVSKLRDFSPLRGLSLTELKADWTGLEDLSPLHGMPIRTLSIQHTKVGDLSVLAGMPLNNLELAGTLVNDIAPLANLPLVRLHLHGCKTLRDLSPLHGRKITWLCFAGTQVEDLSPLRGMPLAGVVCNGRAVRSPQNLAVLRAIPTLKGVNNGPAAKFWQQVDSGQLQATTSTPEQEQATTEPDASATSAAAVATQQPRQTIDLLALTDPVKDRIKVERGASHSKANAWERRGSALAYMSDGGSGKLAPAVAINARSYEIEIEFERLSGEGRFHMDLPLDAKRIVPIVFDNTKLKMINCRAGAPWPVGRGARARVVVRLDRSPNDEQDRIAVRLDGEPVVDWRWQGSANNVAQPGEPHPDFPGQPVTSIYIHKDSYEVRSWQLRVFDGEARMLRDAAAATTTAGASQNTINLLPLIDPQKDAITGEWTVENGGLVGDKEKFAHIEIPYQPPEEYDYRVEFTLLDRKLGGCQVLAKGGKAFQWSFFSHTGGDVFGFSMVNNRFLGDANADARVVLSPAELGRRYVSLVEVRNDGLRGYLDGKLLVTWKTDCKDMSLARFWQLRTPHVLGLGCQSRIAFHRIEVREVTGKGTFTRGAPAAQPNSPTSQHPNTPVTADPAWQNAINLLPLVDLSQDVNSGKWEAAPDGLKATDIKNMSQKIQPPYRPPEEYDYRVSFTPMSGNADVAIGLTAKGRSFVFYMKKYANDHCLGFEAISGKAIARGPTAHRFPHLEMGSRYTVVVEVRKNGLRGYLDGKLVAEWATDYSDMTAWPVWRFKDDTLPGFGCSLSTVVFQEVKLREVSGKGTFTRGGPKP